jgi:hypothetical protein
VNDIRWRGLSHEELYRTIRSGPGPLASSGAQALWPSVEQRLEGIRQRLTTAASTAAAGWEGVAADATRTGLAPLGDWAAQAVGGARRTAGALDRQAEHVATMRNSVPPPPPAGLPERPPGAAADPSLLADWQAADTERARLAQQAVDAMETYTNSSAITKHHIRALAQPPEVAVEGGVTAAVRPAAAGTRPRTEGAATATGSEAGSTAVASHAEASPLVDGSTRVSPDPPQVAGRPAAALAATRTTAPTHPRRVSRLTPADRPLHTPLPSAPAASAARHDPSSPRRAGRHDVAATGHAAPPSAPRQPGRDDVVGSAPPSAPRRAGWRDVVAAEAGPLPGGAAPLIPQPARRPDPASAPPPGGTEAASRDQHDGAPVLPARGAQGGLLPWGTAAEDAQRAHRPAVQLIDDDGAFDDGHRVSPAVIGADGSQACSDEL